MKLIYITLALLLLSSCIKEKDEATCNIPYGTTDVIIHNELNKGVVQIQDGYDRPSDSFYKYDKALKFSLMCNSLVSITNNNVTRNDSFYVNLVVNGKDSTYGCSKYNPNVNL